ncbi:death-inducer obliterator 1 [Pempheris klunzingeri]|uniref:death-inducer obliterator 1 n=1 Tax=Pempheris klunzingeri TaxID=3127111 RepID=UPI0039815BE4
MPAQSASANQQSSGQVWPAEKDSEQVEADSEAVTPSKQSPEDTSTDAAPSSQPATEQAPPQSHSEPEKEPINSGVSKQQSVESSPSISPNPTKSTLSPTAQSPSTSAPRHHETGALMVSKTAYVIPKKQSGPQPPSSHISTSASYQKPSAAPTLLNETRNLPVPPAPSAPSSRPSQPNNQIRQSIQRSLTSILFKRVCDCEDLEMSESEVAKLVASIEMEMFDIFRNTDSKYMNKYRTIMFNLKDPRNKGLLYRVVRGEIGPFRLVRMSQKDMQATKASEPSPKEATELKVKGTAAKATDLLQKPEAVKVDLASLNPAGPDRGTEQKKSLPGSGFKTRTSQPSQSSAVPDILACMLKDTTSEHKTHLFDLKCKICTGQIILGDEEEPAKKKPKVSERKNKYEPSWRKSGGDDSPLRAPPDSPDMDSPTSSPMDPSSRLVIDSPTLTIVESTASPIRDSPASPTLDSPASPVMESPASPTQDSKATTTRAYTPVVIPAVSTVTITRRDPRTAANRFSVLSSGTSGLSNTNLNQSATYAPLKETRSASPPAPASSLPTKPLPKSILMKPSPSADPRLYGASSRTMASESPADGETAKFLAKQDIMWKGFLNMLSVAKFVTKGYLVSGSAENLKADLPDTIQIGGRIMPQTVWDYVAKLKTSVTKELCVMRFQPATEEEEVAYVSLFSYFSSRGRFGVVANNSRSIKDVYLVPLSAKESIPSILQPLDGPGLEKNRPNLLLGLAIIQKTKRPGSLPQEIEEKRPKVHMSKDPMWIPKPPVLYGSDKLEIFQPYDPETPSSTTPPDSPSCPGSPSESSSSGSVSVPSLFTSIRANPSVSTSAAVAATQSTCNSTSNNPTTESSNKTPLQSILKTLFGNKQTDSMDSSDGSSTKTTAVGVKKLPQVTGSMVDPIVQQYGQRSKVKEIEEDENDFDRPYDPEEEYDPAMGYGVAAPQSMEKIKADSPAVSRFVDDDVAYDPEDETIFADIQSDIVAKPPVPTQASDSPSCPTPVSTQAVTSASTTPPVQTCNSAGITQNLPTGIVVVSAATLSEQQRMLEELNKQIEEQKRQLKEQEEALRQQREAVAESEDCHRRSGAIVKGTAIEVLQEGHSIVLLHIPGDVEKKIDTEEVKGKGQSIELETSLNARVVIIKTILHPGILVGIENPHHLLERKIQWLFHQNST